MNFNVIKIKLKSLQTVVAKRLLTFRKSDVRQYSRNSLADKDFK